MPALTLTPTLYMLQVFDRVMQSQNEFTLIALTLILMIFLAAMAFAEFIRSRLLVRYRNSDAPAEVPRIVDVLWRIRPLALVALERHDGDVSRARQLGANALGDACATAEECGRKGDIAGASAGVTAIEREFAVAYEWMRTLTGGTPA